MATEATEAHFFVQESSSTVRIWVRFHRNWVRTHRIWVRISNPVRPTQFLFILYTNDLPNCLSQTKGILFADDTTIYVSGDNKRSMFNDMRSDLEELIEWFRANKLSLNIAKTNYVLFIPPRLKLIDKTPPSCCVLKESVAQNLRL